MTLSSPNSTLKLALPTGRMREGVLRLLDDAGLSVRLDDRTYRPQVSLNGLDAKMLKPQNIVKMLEIGARDIGFAGADWVAELGADLVELVDTELDCVQIVAAAPKSILVDGALPKRPLVIAGEYERLTRQWIERQGLNASFLRSFGTTEVFPPEDADCIVDCTATGATLKANALEIIDVLQTSSTRLYANPAALDDPARKESIDRFVLLLESVLEARRRVMVEVNVPSEQLQAVIDALPCMREPTVSSLHGGGGYAVKAAVPRAQLPNVIPEIKAKGGTDIIVTRTTQIVP